MGVYANGSALPLGRWGDRERNLLARQDNVAALPSLDRTMLFMALPNTKDNTGVLDVINLKDGTSSSRALSEAPRWLVRLGPGGGLWVVGHQEMRPVSEQGEVGGRAIALNKSKQADSSDPEGSDTVLNGDPGQAINLGESRAAMLITNKKGGTLHRVALLDLQQFQLDGVVTISKQKFSESGSGRFLETLGGAAALGAVDGVAAGLSGTPVNLYAPNGMPAGPASEALTAQPDGKTLYVLNVGTPRTLRRQRGHRCRNGSDRDRPLDNAGSSSTRPQASLWCGPRSDSDIVFRSLAEYKLTRRGRETRHCFDKSYTCVAHEASLPRDIRPPALDHQHLDHFLACDGGLGPFRRRG